MVHFRIRTEPSPKLLIGRLGDSRFLALLAADRGCERLGMTNHEFHFAKCAKHGAPSSVLMHTFAGVARDHTNPFIHEPFQKMNFRPSWIWRGAKAAVGFMKFIFFKGSWI